MIGMIVCPTCEGSGKVWFLFWRTGCSSCQGVGQVAPDFVGSHPDGRPRRSSLSSLFWSSPSSTSYHTVRTQVIEEHVTRNIEVDSLAAEPVTEARTQNPAEGDDPSLPLLIDPFAAVAADAEEPETPERVDSEPQDVPESESSDTVDSASDPDQATAY